jgi:hypothetical protein
MRALYRRSAAVVASARSNVGHLGLANHPGEIRIIPYGIGTQRFAESADHGVRAALHHHPFRSPCQLPYRLGR